MKKNRTTQIGQATVEMAIGLALIIVPITLGLSSASPSSGGRITL